MASEPPKVFISYNRADRDWAEWIAGTIERAGYEPIIQAWHFRPGENFVLRMQEAAAQTDFTIAVLSENYLNSEYTQPEWAAAFVQDPTGKRRRLIPVRVAERILTGMLSAIICIDLFGIGEQDAERALLDGLKPSGMPAQPSPFPGKRAELSISTAPFPPSLARLHGVPELPPHYLPREADIVELKRKLLAGDGNVGITGQSSAVGVQGMGGIGKTVLATALAHDPEVRQAFPEGIFWLTVGQKPNLLFLQSQLLRQLTGAQPVFVTTQEGKDALREKLAGRRALVMLDDAWAFDDADALSVNAPPARLLLTTRNQEVLVGLGAEEHRLGVLPLEGAVRVLARWTGVANSDQLPAQARQVAKECGFLPLALAMIGAMVRRSNHPPATAWQDALDCLQASNLEEIKRAFPGYPYADLLRAIEVSVEALDDRDRERYLDLAVFPADQSIPETALRVFWKLDARRTRNCMARFAERSLATIAAEAHPAGHNSALNLHDLQRDLIHKRRKKKLAGLHLRLVEAWDALPKLPDHYTWTWIAHHLVQAGRKDDLRQLLLNFDYLQAKLAATDANALIADYEYFTDVEELCLVQSAIRLSAHVLARDQRQLAGQLTGRLLGVGRAHIKALLKQAADRKPWAWLRPLKPSLTEPGGPLIRTLESHTEPVTAVAVTADGSASSRAWRTIRCGCGTWRVAKRRSF
jgi:hypothetical protein